MHNNASLSAPSQLSPAASQDSAPARLTLIDRFARRIVLSLMERFQRGHLQVVLPDGSTRSFGDADAAPVALHIHTHAFFRAVLFHGEIGFGEAFMQGHWSTDNLPALLSLLIHNLEAIPGMSGSKSQLLAFNCLNALNRLAHFRRRNNRTNSRRNIAEHYDLSNDFYALWLDESWTYSSAWFANPQQESLADAQFNKYDRLCRKLQLKPGMRLLEIGCGWGGFAMHAAKHYGVHVTAVTISNAQFDMAQQRVADANLAHSIDLRLCDYRDLTGQFDAIVSIEMLEAVGHAFLQSFFAQCHRLLAPNGRLGLQVIVCPDSRYDAMRRSADWIKKHIFPGGQLPSVRAMIQAINATGDLYLHHMESFGFHYAKTCQLWRERFNLKRDAVRSLGFDEQFLRKWNYYLAYCEAAFQTRNINVSQLIFSRPNNTDFQPELT